jgi:hypothetical protein
MCGRTKRIGYSGVCRRDEMKCNFFQDGDLDFGIQAMSVERKNWLSKPDLLVRASRHYEGAGQILIRKVVSTAREVSD